MKVKLSLFKTYDIRGKYPEELDEKVIFRVAQTFSILSGAKKIIVARDNRLSSLVLFRALVSGLNSQKVKVIDVGMCSISAFYFAVCYLKTPAGLMITASHLTKEFNGIKAVLKMAVPLSRSQVKKWKKLYIDKKFFTELSAKRIVKTKAIIKKDIKPIYIRAIRKHIKGRIKKLKIVMDAGNGMVGFYLVEVFKGTGLKIIPLFWKPDGSFPNRGPNPKIRKNHKKIIEKIRKEKADFGFLWDGDGDRFYVLDNKGQVIDPSFVSFFIAKYLIKNSKNKKVVADVRTSSLIEKELKKEKGRVFWSKTWHPEIKFKMLKTGAVFGSEVSGHYIFKDFYNIDDGILASIYFLRAISAEKRDFYEILAELKNKYFILPEKNFKIKNKERIDVILNSLEKIFKRRKAKVAKIDGLSCDFPNWRFNLRPSGTEPYLRLNLEADSKNLMQKKEKEISRLINSNLRD